MMCRLSIVCVLVAMLAACSDAASVNNVADSDTGVERDTGVEEDASSTDTSTDTSGSDTALDTGIDPVPLREPGVRAPRTAMCDNLDPARCLLPWPSDTFARADADSLTGLKLEVDPQTLFEGDDVASLLLANGHSRISPLVTVFTERVTSASAGDDGVMNAVRVVVSEPGDRFGELAPVRVRVIPDVDNPDETVVVAYPQKPLEAGTEYAVAVLDSLKDDGGTAPARGRESAVALGLEEPQDAEDAELFSYHNPTRLALEAAGVELDRVVRTWSFTTRSERDPVADLNAIRAQMVAAIEAGESEIRIEKIETAPSPTIAMTVQGTLQVPNVVSESGHLLRDDDGKPTSSGTREAPFRVAVPVGEGDYRVLMYGHGFGGDVSDSSFDTVITRGGAAKVNIQFDDWTEDGVFNLANKLSASVSGSDQAAIGLIESVAMGIAIQYALDGLIGDMLSAEMIEGEANPAAGRRPDTRDIVWVGGSLGGTMGMVYASAEPTVTAAVLNVPGTGLSHYLRFSNLYNVLELILGVNYRFEADRALAVAMGQVNFDRVDGAIWIDAVEQPPICLVQESVGDPVMPNIGTDLVAASLGALHIGAVLHPIWGLESADEAVGRSAVTQYKVSQDRDELGIHGFGDRDDAAGNAAQAQIQAFVDSVWAGEPRIVLPQACVDNGAMGCDFSALE